MKGDVKMSRNKTRLAIIGEEEDRGGSGGMEGHMLSCMKIFFDNPIPHIMNVHRSLLIL